MKSKCVKSSINLLFVIFLLFANIPVIAQGQTLVSGLVTDENKEPLIGVTVQVKNSKTGAITDLGGKFSLNAVPGNVLVFSYIGYKKTEIVFKGQGFMTVLMETDIQVFDEVVVVGYGVQRKSDLTGSLSSVSGSDLAKSAAVNVTQALQGKSAGVYITSPSGQPGAGATIRVRGYGSISTDNTPLYVVDGQPIEESQVNNIPTGDIENIEILKDASACAIYGSRGANGVVLITTKKGETGKTIVTLDNSVGWSQMGKTIDMMNSDQLYDFLGQLYANDGKKLPRDYKFLYELDLLNPDSKENVYDTNWWDECTRTGFYQNHNVSVRGGSEKLKSYLSIGYYDETGVINSTSHNRLTLRSNNEYKINNYITIGNTLGMAKTKTKDLNLGVQEILLPDPFTPVIDPRVDPSSPNYEFNKYMPTQYSYYNNPVQRLNENFKEHCNFNVDGTFYADINLGLKGLYFKSLIGFERLSYNLDDFNPTYRMTPSDFDLRTGNKESDFRASNKVTNESNWNFNYSIQNTLRYANTFGKHDLAVTVGMTYESREGRSMMGEGYNVPDNILNFHVLDATTENKNVGGTRWEEYLISYLGRINYNYDDRYLLTINGRIDGSSKFARGNRWGTFPSFSVGWKFTNEKFFRNLGIENVLSSGKLRVGWGQNGNQRIPANAYANLVGTYLEWKYSFNDTWAQGYGVLSNGNKDLKWETSEQTNIGFDFGLFQQSLTLSADYYIRKTKDMLMQVPLPDMGGYVSTPWSNAGSVENRGFELQAIYKHSMEDFFFSVGANMTFNKNKLTAVGTSDGNPIWGSKSKNEIGKPFGQFYGYVYDGIFQTSEEVQSHVGSNGTVLQPNAKPGDIRFKNVDGNDKLDAEDRTYIGNPNPKIIYGGNINMSFKGFDFSLFLQGIGGCDIVAGPRELYQTMNTVNLPVKAYEEAWRNPGDKTDMPRISMNNTNENYRFSSWWVTNGSFLKVKTMQVGYTLPSKWLVKTNVLSSVRIYLSGENLFTISGYEFMDPETSNSAPLDLGIASLNYPNTRKYTLGVSVQF